MKKMPFLYRLLMGISLVGGSVEMSRGAVIVADTFDYENVGALQAAWGTAAGLSLSTTDGNPANAAAHSGAASVHIWQTPFSVTPTDDQPLVLTADLWYSGSNNQRNTVGLRTSASPLFEMGFYNQAPGNGLAVRVLNFAGGSGAWTALASYTDLGSGAANATWITLEATFTSTSLTVTWDLGANGTIDGTWEASGTTVTGAFSDLRFGGPSAGSSAGGGFLVDNIRLETIPVPEPTSVTFALMGASLVLRRRRR